MPFFSKSLKDKLDWVSHGKLVFDLLSSAAAFHGAHAMLVVFHVAPIWFPALEWSSAAVAFGAVMYATRNFSLAPKQVSPPETSLAISMPSNALLRALRPDPGKFDSHEFFRTAFYSCLQDVSANSFKAEAERVRPNDKESFYLDVLAVGSLGIHYNDLFTALYRSQLRAMLELNSKFGHLPVDGFRKYYDEAALEFSEDYKRLNITFDEWMKFLVDSAFIIIHPSKMVEITVKGKDFLKYLLHWGKTEQFKRL